MMAETKVLTGKVRLSYAHLFKAVASEGGGDPKFSTCLLISKKDQVTIGKIKTAIEAAKQQLKMPLRDGDGDKPDRPEFKGMYFLNANSKTAPLVVDLDKQDIIDQTEVYSGCFARASITFYPFNTAGNRGIGCGLNGIQKVADGEPLGGGRQTADEMFGDDEDPLG